MLSGVRRCGKSVLLSQIKDEMLYLGKANEEHIIFINLEDFKFMSLNNANKLNSYINKLIKDDKKYFFIDEIQHINQFERVLASLKATKSVSIFITGSNSNLLSGKLATLLVGRCVEFKIMPFSYVEFLNFYLTNNLPLPKEQSNRVTKIEESTKNVHGKEVSFNKDTQPIDLNKAKDIVLAQLSDDVKDYINNSFGDVNTWITTQIEASINTLKNSY